MALGTILWVDDEIDSLQSHIIFLRNKGYDVNAMTNGLDAIDFVKENLVDVVLLDETMPGISGLETLAKIKETNQQIPVVLITKNETENLMDEAQRIGDAEHSGKSGNRRQDDAHHGALAGKNRLGEKHFLGQKSVE